MKTMTPCGEVLHKSWKLQGSRQRPFDNRDEVIMAVSLQPYGELALFSLLALLNENQSS
mgnify:CR=1 FL=1